MAGPVCFKPSVDLVKEAHVHWIFLHKVYRTSDLHQDSCLQYALWRYETKWLPLLAANQDKEMEPPLDVHWLWHVHMLCPTKYIEDCKRLINCVPNHRFHSVKEQHTAEKTAKCAWKKLYPDDPFEYQTVCQISAGPPDGSFKSKLSYDIITAAHRQKNFFYHVSLPHFTDKHFIRTSTGRYRKFIALKKIYPKSFLVPVYDIDFVWHTHQLCPHAYHRDTMEYLGYILNHDDSSTSRSPGSKLSESGAKTRQLWKKEFGEDLAQPGTLHRGSDARGQIETLSAAKMQAIAVKKCTYIIESIRIEGPKDIGAIRLKLDIVPLMGDKRTLSLPTRYSSPYIWTSKHDRGICAVQTTPDEDVTIDIQISHKKGGLLNMLQKARVFGVFSFHLSNELTYHTDHKTGEYIVSHKLADGAVISVELVNSECSLKNMTLLLEMSPFEKLGVKEINEEFWGPLYLPDPLPGIKYECCVATHRLIHSKQKSEAFTCRILHSLTLRMSVVHVMHQGQIVVLAHTIGPDHLPTPDQVSSVDHYVTLDQRQGVRAMLIKNSLGDWGIITGQWEGFKRGIPAAGRFNEGIPGDQGHLKVVFTRLTSKGHKRSECTVLGRIYNSPNSPRSQHFTLYGIQVALNKSTISLRPLWGEDLCYPEKVAMVFSALTLYVLCQPRPDVGSMGHVPTPLARLKREIDPVFRGGREIEALCPYKYPLIQAAGHMEDTPSNSWLYWLSHHSNPQLYTKPAKYRRASLQTDNTCIKQPHVRRTSHGNLRCNTINENDNSVNHVTCDLDEMNSIFCPWDPDDEWLGYRYGAVCGGCGGCGSSCFTGYSSSGFSQGSGEVDEDGFTISRRDSLCVSLCRMFSSTDSESSASRHNSRASAYASSAGGFGHTRRFSSQESFSSSLTAGSSFNLKQP